MEHIELHTCTVSCSIDLNTALENYALKQPAVCHLITITRSTVLSSNKNTKKNPS